jgi:hypothetical protein
VECFCCNCSTVQPLGELTISLLGPVIGAVLIAAPRHTRGTVRKGLMYFVCNEILECDFTNGRGKVVPALNALKPQWLLYVPSTLTY